MIREIKLDIEKYNLNPSLLNIIKLYFSTKGIQAVILFRISSYFYNRKLRIL